MNKKLGIASTVILLLIAGGAAAYIYMKPASTTKNPELSKMGVSNSSFSSIQEVFSKNLTLRCDIDGEEGQKTVTYIKNGKIRVDVAGKTANEDGSVIMKENKMYFWNAQGGFIMEFNMEEMKKGMANVTPPTNSNQNPQEYLSMVEKYKESCKAATVDDNLFIPPANVTFQDVSQMMKQIPSGVPAGQVDQEKIQKMMEQYTTPQP